MKARDCDIAIIGGGLSGGLIALALAQHRPEVRVRLIEAGPVLGGNHRWSWFEGDLPEGGEELLAGCRKTQWQQGYAVCFPKYRRKLGASYCSLASEDFAATLHRALAPDTIMTGSEVDTLDAGGVSLRDGTRINARSVIDCRGFASTADLTGGWQVFMGRHIRTAEPHGLTQPVIMDAEVDQVAPAGNGGAYRFVYVLPLGSHDVFVEDTYYADKPEMDRAMLSGRIDQYCRAAGLEGEPVGFETGVLPVITGGNFRAFQKAHRVPGVAVAGARGGFVHPLTSYTLPFAVETALAVAHDADLPGDQMAAKLEARARSHWRKTWFYRMLGRMLFAAAVPEQRYRVFEHFYRLSENLVERFYSARSTWADRLRVLVGKPPVPISRAIRALTTNPVNSLAPPKTPGNSPAKKDS